MRFVESHALPRWLEVRVRVLLAQGVLAYRVAFQVEHPSGETTDDPADVDRRAQGDFRRVLRAAGHVVRAGVRGVPSRLARGVPELGPRAQPRRDERASRCGP